MTFLKRTSRSNGTMCLLLLMLIAAGGCNEKTTVNVSIAPTELEGSIRIEDGETVILSENLKRYGGEYQVNVPKPDFYELKVFPNGAEAQPVTYVYLDGKDLRIETQDSAYPVVTSASAHQKDVSRYYRALYDGRRTLSAAYESAKESLAAGINRPGATGDELHVLATNLSDAQKNYTAAETAITQRFITTNPGALFSAFLLAKMNENELSKDPGNYRTLFDQLDPEVKESRYGQAAGLKILEHLKASAGTMLPEVAGKNPAGKPFEPQQIRGKLTLVVFWRSVNRESARELLDLKELYKKHHQAGFEILAVSFDKTPERWNDFIQTNKLPWINICDFKGASSPNLKNFNNDRIPFYILVGPDLKIIARDVRPSELPIYLKEHLVPKAAPGSV